MPTDLLRLSVFDQDVTIQTDSTVYLELLRKTYSHFLVDQPFPEGHVPFNVSFCSGQDNPTGRPQFNINGEGKLFEDPRLLRTEYVHGLILSSLYSQVSSHYLFHAAALSFKEKGMIITADSGYGKTTLTLALIQRGFRFLSDEIAALGRSDGLIYPFPRGLHVREETLNLLDIHIPLEKASRWFDKYLIDIEDIFPGMVGGPANISHVFVLNNGTNPALGSLHSHQFKAVISHTTPEFLQHVQKYPEISGVQVNDEQDYPCLIVQTEHRMNVISYIENLCYQHGIIVLDLIKREDEIPDFSPAVQCQRISRSQAALELLRHFLGGYKTAILTSKDHQDPTSLLFELASILGNADCYQISVGPLQEMLEVISNLVCNEIHSHSPNMGDQ